MSRRGGGGAISASARPPVPAGGLLTFDQYQTSVLLEMLGWAAYGSVAGGQGAVTPTVVTSTADSGAGTLRAALTGGSNRWIYFDPAVFPPTVETTINLTSAIQMYDNNNITLDGFGSLVRVTGYGIISSTFVGPPTGATHVSNNLCFINIKITNITLGDAWDCLTIDGTDRMWFYHLDLSQGGDGNLDITNIFAGPNAYGMMSIQNCYIHDSKTGKGCLLGDETESYGDYVQASSAYPSGIGGDNRLTIVNSRFKDSLRNPVLTNYWGHYYNNYFHGWTYEGPAIWGFNAELTADYNVLDGTGAGANASKGYYAETWGAYGGGSDHSRDYKQWSIGSHNVYLGGATALDASGGYLNPAGKTMHSIPYSWTPEVVNGDSGAALISRLTSATLTNTGRAGVIQRNGYSKLVLGI